MPALSKKQQKFMGIVRSIQKGEQPASKFSKDAQDVAKDMKKKDVKKFAATKHKGLPMKKEVLKKLKEMIRQELSEYTYGSGDIVKDVNPTCPHYGAMGKVKSVGPRSVVFVVMNKGKNFKPGMELEKSHDQMKKMNESMELKKLEDAILMFQKKIKKQGRVTNARDEDHLKNLIKVYKQMGGRKIKESVNEMSAKSKKIINKLNKKEKEMFMDMIDIMGFDQVMADYKRDKKAFKQALKDMSEGFASAAQRRAAFASGYKAKGKKKKKKEGVNETTYKFKGYTASKMDELDAMLSRAGIKGTPNFNDMTYSVNKKSSKIDRIMKMNENLDTGPILKQISCPINDNDTGATLHNKLAKISAENINVTLKKIIANNEYLLQGFIAQFASLSTKFVVDLYKIVFCILGFIF